MDAGEHLDHPTQADASVPVRARTFQPLLLPQPPVAPKRRPRYVLASTLRDGRPLSEAPWARAIRSVYAEAFASSPAGELAISLLAGSRLLSTVSSYTSKFGQFLSFCVETGRDPLRCAALDGVEYIAWQGLRGQVFAKNLQPYVSA